MAELTFVRINDLAAPPEPTHPLMCPSRPCRLFFLARKPRFYSSFLVPFFSIKETTYNNNTQTYIYIYIYIYVSFLLLLFVNFGEAA